MRTIPLIAMLGIALPLSAAHAAGPITPAGGIAGPGSNPSYFVDPATGTGTFKKLLGDVSGTDVTVNGVLGQLDGVLQAMITSTAQAQATGNSAVTLLNQPLNVGTLPSTPAGTNHVGSVGVDTLPALPTGSNLIGSTSSPTLAPAAASATTLISAAATVLPALATRRGWVLSNASASGASGYAYCTDDGSTPTPTHWTIIVYAQSTTSSPPGVPISPAIIQCAPPTGAASDINVTGEQW